MASILAFIVAIGPLYGWYRGVLGLPMSAILTVIGMTVVTIVGASPFAVAVPAAFNFAIALKGWMALGAWRAMAQRFGLEMTRKGTGWKASGTLDGVAVTMEYGRSKSLRWESRGQAEFPESHVGELSVTPRGRFGGGDIQISDSDLMRQAELRGAKDVALLTLDATVRQSLAVGLKWGITVDSKRTRWRQPALVGNARSLLSAARSLVRLVQGLTFQDEHRESRHTSRIYHEPNRHVRVQLLDLAAERLEQDPRMENVLLSATHHPDPYTAIQAGTLLKDASVLYRLEKHSDPRVGRKARVALVELGFRIDPGAGALTISEPEPEGGGLSFGSDDGKLSL